MRKACYAIPYQDVIKTSYFGEAKQWEGLVPSTYRDTSRESRYS